MEKRSALPDYYGLMARRLIECLPEPAHQIQQIEHMTRYLVKRPQWFTLAGELADQALQLKARQAQVASPDKRIISFSLYGSQALYGEMLIVNAELRATYYPEWVMRVYHDDSVPQHVLTRLARLQVELVDVGTLALTEPLIKMPGTFWRFLALADPDAAVVILRDADSLFSEREVTLVRAWLDSGQPFHVMRDWYEHTDLILAGLWGARNGLLAGICDWIADYLRETPQLHPTHADQQFLAAKVWWRIRPFVQHHSSVTHGLTASWPENLPRLVRPDNTEQLGAWQITEYRFNAPGTVRCNIWAGEELLCTYLVPAGQMLELPRAYRKRIESGEYQLDIKLA